MDLSSRLKRTTTAEGDWNYDETKKRSGNAKISLRALWAGRMGAGAQANADKQVSSAISLKGVLRESTSDLDVDKLLPTALAGINFRANNMYFIIRETVGATEIAYKISKEDLIDIGGDIALKKLASADLGFSWQGNQQSTLNQQFKKPFRIFYKVEELKKTAGAMGGPVTIGRTFMILGKLCKNS